MRLIILTGILFLTSFNCSGQKNPEQIIEEFFKNYETKTPEEALEELYRHMPAADRVDDDIASLEIKFKGLKKVVGNYIDYDLITKKDLLNRYIIYTYLVRFEHQPIRFTFEFYKPKENWGLFGFSYDDDFDEELEETTKIYFIE